MARIEWHEGLELGVKALDDQHKHLLDLANQIIAAAKHSAGKELVEGFHGLREYTVRHFKDEEDFMQRVKYPNLYDHMQQHLHLKDQVKHFQESLYKHAEISEDQIILFMKEWLIDHIVFSDLEIKKFLSGQDALKSVDQPPRGQGDSNGEKQ